MSTKKESDEQKSYEIECADGRKIRFSVVSEDQYARDRADYKKKYEIYEYSELEKLPYPCNLTIHYEYFGTCEGTTSAIMLIKASNADEVRRLINKEWGYYGEAAEIRIGFNPLPRYEALIAPAAEKMMKSIIEKKGGPAAFRYCSTLHTNYS